MKKFFRNRVLPFVCVFSILISLCNISAFAFDAPDYQSVAEWESAIRTPSSSIIDQISGVFGCDSIYTSIFWGFVDRAIDPVGSVSHGELEGLCSSYNSLFNSPLRETFFGQLFYKHVEIQSTVIATLFSLHHLRFEIQRHPSSGLYRIKEVTNDIWLVDSAGRYAYCDIQDENSTIGAPGVTEAGDHWIGEVSASDRAKSGSVALHTLDRLNLMCNRLKEAGIDVQLKILNDVSGQPKYKGIWWNRQFYASPTGEPYVAPYNPGGWAVNDEREDTIVKDENGNVIEGLPEDVSSGIDLEKMLIYLPNGTIGLIDNLTYDESTKTYNVDSHDVTNNYYYYHYEYHINYTSITYIGQTEEYNKYYEVYYELPDGRDSADLTKEDLEQLNVSIDVIPYARNVDDTSLRSLYHFDGDTRDASYWSYCTDFVWNEGASLTYMDAGVFEGALYLDEQEHEFTLTLPSNITADDFTLQWRYYQSHTEAPVTDSYINFGDEMVLQWSGGYFSDPDGEALHVTPTGTWNEVALIRDSGVIYYYLNGVCMGSWASTYSYRDTITFHFGDEQQTFKYFDELRFLDYALQTGGANYTPTAVPHDTNLSLTVPTESVPVADEYWSITNTPGYLSYIDFTTGVIPGNVVATTKPTEIRNNKFPGWGYLTDKMDIQYFDGYAELTRISNTFGSSDGLMYGGLHSYVAYYSKLSPTASGSQYYGGFTQLQDYTVTIIHRDGTIEKLPLYYEDTDADNRYICSVDASFGKVYIYRVSMSGAMNVCLVVYPEKDMPVELVGIEVCVGESQLEAEWVESVTIFDEASLTTPTLAVRTDLEITSHQIGGVRPSVPEKGMVWALVENQRITSLQIYNGQAWEGVDGRIWTGTRWIPASSYNIITLQDMYDIVDATPDYEYIYTESGFWSWWQKSWIAFTDQLFTALGSGGSGGSGADGGDGSNGLDGVDLDSQDPELIPEEEDSKTFWQFILLLIVGGKSVVSGVREISSGAVSSVPESMDTIVDAFDSGGLAVGVLDGSYLDPDAADLPQDDSGEAVLAEVEEVDPWRYR